MLNIFQNEISSLIPTSRAKTVHNKSSSNHSFSTRTPMLITTTNEGTLRPIYPSLLRKREKKKENALDRDSSVKSRSTSYFVRPCGYQTGGTIADWVVP